MPTPIICKCGKIIGEWRSANGVINIGNFKSPNESKLYDIDGKQTKCVECNVCKARVELSG